MTLNDLESPFCLKFCFVPVFGAVKPGFRSLATLKLVMNVVGELKPKRIAVASRGFLATARLSCTIYAYTHKHTYRADK